ncbi:esterase-like activity of phytase family protein [Streptomyces sp. SID9124]|uniref:esterase-like activity of phytase family protein n=1 Tax=Streptomyces sp. SID9124 TaxID=2706108 RepID=UPI0013DE80A4|nr:esterase-like activity of phytase family protein [Streptomyces sp. SID9124]NED11889.1 esterase-like activity of phytase family protein [Streptomyces sp. SID9124]
MRSYRLTSSLGAAALLALAAAPALAADDGADRSFTIEDPRITESSGLAASRAHPGIYWTHNDSDDGPYVFAVDSRTGRTVARITMKGVGQPRDVEAISLGPDGNLYVGDIGDNLDGSWDHVWIYRFPEPKVLKDATVRATQFDVKYADGPRNAEALMVHPRTGRVYIASKNEDGGGLYEGPAELTTGGDNVFRRVGEVPWVTDGAFSPDGKELVLRSYFSARGYTFANGRLGKDYAVESPLLPQSESVTFTADGSALMYGSEGERSSVVRVDLEKGGDGGGGGAAHRAGGTKDTADGDGTPVKGTTLTGGAVLAALALLLLLGRKRRKG